VLLIVVPALQTLVLEWSERGTPAAPEASAPQPAE
jgi:hypothetical protein